MSRPGSKAADEQVFNRDVLRDDAVQDQRHRQRKEQAERTGGGEQSDRKPFAIALLQQRRQQQPAKREDRHARAAGEQREERTERGRGDRGSARRPAEQRPAAPARSRSDDCPSASRKPVSVNSGIAARFADGDVNSSYALISGTIGRLPSMKNAEHARCRRAARRSACRARRRRQRDDPRPQRCALENCRGRASQIAGERCPSAAMPRPIQSATPARPAAPRSGQRRRATRDPPPTRAHPMR